MNEYLGIALAMFLGASLVYVVVNTIKTSNKGLDLK